MHGRCQVSLTKVSATVPIRRCVRSLSSLFPDYQRVTISLQLRVCIW